MAQLLEFLLILLAVILLGRGAAFLFRRAKLLFAVLRLGAIDGARRISLRPFAFFLPSAGAKPAAEIELTGVLYRIRILNGGGAFCRLHFADRHFSVCFPTMRITGSSKHGAPVGSRSISFGGRVRILPDLAAADGFGTAREEEILLLSPLPAVMTYVTAEKTAIRLAFTGDRFYGRRVFGINAFARFLDRQSRSGEEKRIFYEE